LWDNVLLKPTEFPPEDHTHEIEDVDGLPEALAGLSSDVGDLTTTGLTPGEFLRVADPSGVESVPLVLTRTAAEGPPGEGVKATGELSISALGGIVTIGSRVYRTVGLPVTNPGDIYATTIEEMVNRLSACVRGEPNANVVPYSPAAHPDVTVTFAGSFGYGFLQFEAIAAGTAGNSIVTTAVGVNISFANPTLVGGSEGLSPRHIGDRCIVGDDGAGALTGNGNYLEYTSLDGVTWTLTGPSNVRESTDTPGSIIGTTWSGDVPTWTLTTITDYLTA
jgi:hypothetical protein